MDAFKLENFVQENPGATPPRFAKLSAPESRELTERLLVNAGQPKGTPQDILRKLSSLAKSLDIDISEVETSLLELFWKSGISPGASLYVQWGPFRDIDRFQTDELIRYFYDVWYPGADDIKIFDDSLAWAMFVRHYGGVEVLRLIE